MEGERTRRLATDDQEVKARRERREVMTDQHSDPISGGTSGRTEGQVRSRAATHRPGMVTFAAVMMFVVAGFEAFWGILDLIIALIALYAGISLLRGDAFGLVMGYLFAIVGAIRWLFVIPAAPVLAVVVIALCVMVIYGLAKYSDQLGST
jgi:hypothetical protein